MRNSRRTVRGFALIETIVVGTLLLLVVQVSWGVTAVQSSVALRVAAGAHVLDEARLIGHVLASELGYGGVGRDWEVMGGELHLRAFRGMGIGCPIQPSSGWGVTVSGHRQPDPDKDSVLALSPDGTWRASALVRRARGRGLDCPPVTGFDAEVWHLDPPRSDALVGVYFERGAYRFSNGAFRYRRGKSGWQPLTRSGLATDSSTLSALGEEGVQVQATWRGPGQTTSAYQWSVWGRR